MHAFGPLVFSAALAVFGATGADAALVISKAQTRNVTCAAGVCTATAADAVLNFRDVKRYLTFEALKIVCGSEAQDIVINAALKWTHSLRLTLDAWHSITFTQPVTVEGTGAVTLLTNDGGTGGDYSFIDKGKIAFWDLSSSLIINGTGFTLVGDIATLAAGANANPSGAFALAKGYDASVDGTYAASPITVYFAGTFEGLGHAIMNFALDDQTSTQIGLFGGGIADNGTVRDLEFTGAQIKAGRLGYDVGVLTASNGGTLRNVTVAGSIETDRTYGVVGLLAGSNGVGGLIVDCHSSGYVGQNARHGAGLIAGGLIGYNFGTITQSSSSSLVRSAQSGGLVGENESTITLSFATGPVFGVVGNAKPSAGGLVGFGQRGSIDRSFATGAVEGASGSAKHYANAGGLVGSAKGNVVTNSYATGTVSVGNWGRAGGLSSIIETAQNTYAAGSVTSADPDSSGGFVHHGGSHDASDYWDIDTGGATLGCVKKCAGITGLTDTQLKSALPAGFDPAIWAQNASTNNGYPYLLDNPPPQ